MLLHLIKKDFVIARKYVWLMFIVVLLIPPFIMWRMPELTGSISFVISAVFAEFMLLMYVSMKEFQYQKASAMLCTTPYPRSLVVMSKYDFSVPAPAVIKNKWEPLFGFHPFIFCCTFVCCIDQFDSSCRIHINQH